MRPGAAAAMNSMLNAWVVPCCCSTREEEVRESDLETTHLAFGGDGEEPRTPSEHWVSPNCEEEAPSALLIELKKRSPTSSLRLLLDAADRATLHVCKAEMPSAGPVWEYNSRAEWEHQLRPGDFIVAVNGERGDSVVLLSLMLSTASLTIEVRRPYTWTAVVRREGERSLGLEMHYVKEGKSLVINGISEGPVLHFNEDCPDKAIRRFDHVLAVNGQEGSSDTLLKALQQPGDVTLALSRPCNPSGAAMSVLPGKQARGGARSSLAPVEE